jgi:hypothetical protein
MLVILQKEGQGAEVSRAAKKIPELMQIRFGARQVERRGQRALRGRQHPPDRAQDSGPRGHQGRGMPRPEFIKKFPEHETSLR